MLLATIPALDIPATLYEQGGYLAPSLTDLGEAETEFTQGSADQFVPRSHTATPAVNYNRYGRRYRETEQKGAHGMRKSADNLLTAAMAGDTEEVEYILDNDPYTQAGTDRALIFAASYGHTDTVALLLDRGADIHADDDQALYQAKRRGHADTEELLYNWGAALNYEYEVAEYGHSSESDDE